MLASVVMAVHNGAEYLHESVESILAQGFQGFEFIIVNDGSTDKTVGILNYYQDKDRRIRVYHQEHSGLVASLNKGCRLARGKYIVRMDADDIAFPDRLERQLGFLEHNPKVALLGGAYVLMNSNGAAGMTMVKPLGQSQINAMMHRRHNPFLHPTIVMRKEAFLSLKGYRTAFPHAEDYELWLRFTELYCVANLPQPVVYYRVHHSQVSHQHLEQGIISVLAAQAAARIRRKTGADPMWQIERVTADVLHRLGIEDRVIQKTLTEAYFWQANMMLLSGYEATGIQLFGEALNRSRSRLIRKKLGRWLCEAYAKARKNRSKPARCILLEAFLLLNALCIQVSLARQLVWFKIQGVCRYPLKVPALEGINRAPTSEE